MLRLFSSLKQCKVYETTTCLRLTLKLRTCDDLAKAGNDCDEAEFAELQQSASMAEMQGSTVSDPS